MSMEYVLFIEIQNFDDRIFWKIFYSTTFMQIFIVRA